MLESVSRQVKGCYVGVRYMQLICTYDVPQARFTYFAEEGFFKIV